MIDEAEFQGEIRLSKPLTPEHKAYLKAFAGTRRMERNANKTAKLPDSLREAVGLPVGVDGGYYVGGPTDGFYGQSHSRDIQDFRRPPGTQPNFWCHWVPSEDGTCIVWDGRQKFRGYGQWLEYLVLHFLEPWGYALNGTICRLSETDDWSTQTTIVVENNYIDWS